MMIGRYIRHVYEVFDLDVVGFRSLEEWKKLDFKIAGTPVIFQGKIIKIRGNGKRK